MFKKIVIGLLGFVVVFCVGALTFGPKLIESGQNTRADFERPALTTDSKARHDELLIMDWHTDSMLWDRDILERSDYGHVDIPRAQDGNLGLMMFTSVTKSPSGQNYEENSADSDTITSLVMVQGWPVRTWGSLLERALYQSEKLHAVAERSEGTVRILTNKNSLDQYLKNRKNGMLGAILGSEGSHPLEGKLENIDRMFAAGYRMMGITHFFDNALAGSLHGISKNGLTDFGKQAIKRFDELEMMIDLAHVSETAAWQVLELSDRPQVVSHTGFKGHCESQRNYPDDLMQAIAAKGGLIAVGFWDEAACGATPADIAGSILYGINLVSADHVALGSDWDGATQTMTADELPLITQALIEAGISDTDLKKVMGENSVKFLQSWLPN